MSTVYGYVRVSTKDQNETRQVIAMTEYGVKAQNIVVEKQSGKDFNRPQYKRLMRYIAEMGELDLRLIAATANHPRITCDDGSMANFAREYGVEYVREGENLLVLSAYTTPSEEDMQLSYCQLMLRNLEKLEAQN